MVKQVVSYESEEVQKVGVVLSALSDLCEKETLPCYRELLEVAFADSMGKVVIDALLGSSEPLSLRAIAVKCDSSRRSVLPQGRLRVIVDRLLRSGMLVSKGGTGMPRYCLERGDKRVQLLIRMYRPLRLRDS